MGCLDWRTGGLSGGVDGKFELIDDELLCILHLYISESCILLSSTQCIVPIISVNTEFKKLRLYWCIFIKGGRTRRLNYVVALV